MRGFLLLFGLSAVGCFYHDKPRDPQVTIISPGGGTTVTDHEPVTITVQVDDVFVDKIALAVDGTTLSTTGIAVTPAPDGRLCEPCMFQIVWPALDAKEGARVVSVYAFGDDQIQALANVDMTFDDAPEIVQLTPSADEDLLGVGTVNIELDVLERGEATVALDIDGIAQEPKTSNECIDANGCSFSYTWDTSTIAAGDHDLHVTITDKNGHTVEETRTVKVDDLVKLTSMQVTMTTDGGILEMEVYVFDNVTNALLGCVGSAHGMGPVDSSDVRYAVDAQLVNPSGAPLRGAELGTRAIRFEAWEDDDAPVCPTPINPNGNNLVAASPAKTVAQWKAGAQPITFGNVTELAFVIGRPLTR